MAIVGYNNELNRELWLQYALHRIPVGSRILDAGAGEQQFRRFCTHLDYVAQDFGGYDGRGDGVALQTGTWDQSGLDIMSDICAIPEPDESFDAIMCIEVFEHLPDPISAIKEFSRLLKKDGYLIITAPFSSLTHFSPHHYYSGFNSFFYEKYLRCNSFGSVEISANGNFFEVVAQEIHRIDYVVKEYSESRISWLERYCLKIVLSMLERISNKDKGSARLLCHGYNVLCRKR